MKILLILFQGEKFIVAEKSKPGIHISTMLLPEDTFSLGHEF